MIDVCCAIIELKLSGRRLVCAAQKGPESHLAGLWEFPGGKVEPSETPHEAVIREIREELGITVSIDRELTPNIHDYGTHKIRLIPFICTMDGSPLPRPHDHAAIGIMPPSSLRGLSWAPADIPILEEYLSTFQ